MPIDPMSEQVILAALGVIVALITLWVVLRQQQTMGKQTELMQRQLSIAQKQDELLARSANLILRARAEFTDADHTTCNISFTVENLGNKTALDFYWHVFVPVEYSNHSAFRIPNGFEVTPEKVNLQPGAYDLYKGFMESPLYPTRRVALGTLTVKGPNLHQPALLFWKLIGEDGKFPSGEEFGEFRIAAT